MRYRPGAGGRVIGRGAGPAAGWGVRRISEVGVSGVRMVRAAGPWLVIGAYVVGAAVRDGAGALASLALAVAGVALSAWS